MTKNNGGFTLLEVIVAVAILGILSAVVVTNFLFFKRDTNLNNDTQEVAGFLRLAQNKTLASENNSQYGVYFDSVGNKYILYKGASYVARDTSYDQIRSLSGEIEFSSISLGGANEVVFNKLTGSAGQSGSVSLRVKTNTSQTKAVYISGGGVVSFASETLPSDSNRVKDSRHIHFDYSRTINNGSESITLDFDNGAVFRTFPISSYLVSGQIQWEGTILAGGSNQTIKIKTHRLNSPGTQFSVHRDRRFNNKSLKITISGDGSGNLANYSSDGSTVTYSSVYASNLIWQ